MWISLLKSVSLLGFFFFNQEGAGLKSNRLIIEDKSLGDVPQSNFRAGTNFIKLQS